MKKIHHHILISTALLLSTSHVHSMHKTETLDYLNEVFSGTGQMSAQQTLSTIFPSEIVLLNVNVNLEKKLSWKFVDQKRSSIMDELARQLNFNWKKIDHRILITKNESISAPTPQVNARNSSKQDIDNRLVLSLVDEKAAPSKAPTERPVLSSTSKHGVDGAETLQLPKSKDTNRESKRVLIAQNTRDLASLASTLNAFKTNSLEESSKKVVSFELETYKSKPAGRFEITQEDETLSSAFKRWSTQEGYQLVWDADKDFPAIQTLYTLNTIEEAILSVMKDIENTDYPLHACIYKNKVLRIVPMTKVCERQKAHANE